MSLPIQVWVPFLQYSPLQQEFARDYHRAQAVWQGEDRVWLMTSRLVDMDSVVRWHRTQSGVRIRECLTGGEQLNCYDVYCVDERRRLYPVVGRPEQFWHTLPEGLYRQWVNASPQGIPAPSHFTWDLPRLIDRHVVMSTAKLTTSPGAVVPSVRIVDGQDERIVMGWPPPGWKGPAPVSPETESSAVYGKLRRARVRRGNGEFEAVLTEHDPKMLALPYWLRWPDLFGAMFPLGGGVDLLYHRTLMRQCIQDLVDGHRAKAMRIIEVWVQRLTGEGEALTRKAWFMPKLSVSIDEALMEVEGRFGIAAENLSQLTRSTEFNRLMDSWTPVRRTHGWLGYFWWELYQDVQARVAVRFCRSCGSVIRGGHADRQYCTRQENTACARDRNSRAQKKARAAKTSRSQKRAITKVKWV